VEYDASSADMKAAQKEYDQVIADVINDVSQSYFEYERALLTAQDQQKMIEKMERFANFSKQKWQEGLISEIEYLNVDSIFSQMKFDYETSIQELELAELELQKYLGLSMDDEVTLEMLYDLDIMLENEKARQDRGGKGGGASISTAPSAKDEFTVYTPIGELEIADLKQLVEMAYENRPELQIEAARLQSARFKERVNFGELMPHVDAVIEFGRLGEAFNTVSLDPKLRNEFRFLLEFTWNAAGNNIEYTFENNETAPSVSEFEGGRGTQITSNTLTVGFLDGLDALAEAKEAQVEKLEQIIELENTEKEVIHDVKEAYFNHQRALIQMQSNLKRVDYRQRLVALAKHRLENNEVQISEYMQAEVDLMRERTDLHKSLNDYFSAKAELNRATGKRDLMDVEKLYGTQSTS